MTNNPLVFDVVRFLKKRISCLSLRHLRAFFNAEVGSMAILKMQNIKKDFVQGGKTLQVLRGVSHEFEQGKSYALVGASGSGKSTLLHILGGLDQPDHGAIFFEGQDIFKLKNKDQFHNQHLGFVFQFHYLIKELTVVENIMLMGQIKGDSASVCKNRAEELLEAVGLTEKTHSYPEQLSGGQQQRVAVARAIFNKPAFLLADEPTGNLDADSAASLVQLLLGAVRSWGMGLVLCSHDKAVYEKMETVLLMHDGVLVQR